MAQLPLTWGAFVCIIIVYNTAQHMTATIQQELNTADSNTDYNGWANWTTWNCALWIGGDEGLYNIARRCDSWFDFIVEMSDMGMNQTPDGAKWTQADYDEMMEMMEDL